jgi:hypothetical protein
MRRHFFLTEPAIQSALLHTCAALGVLFQASNCIITGEGSPVIVAFRDGARFDDAPCAAGPTGGEVESIDKRKVTGKDGAWP